MRLLNKLATGSAFALTGGALLWAAGMTSLSAADHFDPPQRTDQSVNAAADVASDIADVYLYHTATSLILSVDFAGPRPPSEPARYDRDVLYNIFLSNAGSKLDAEFNIQFRFGQDRTNPAASGIQISGIPGSTATIVGPVESTLTGQNGVRLFSGLIDDPFNFDAVGLRLTRESGTLMFNNTRNRFAQMNTTALIIEIPLDQIRNGDNRITAWATAARIIPA